MTDFTIPTFNDEAAALAEQMSDIAARARKLATLSTLHPVARESLSRTAATLSHEVTNIWRVTR